MNLHAIPQHSDLGGDYDEAHPAIQCVADMLNAKVLIEERGTPWGEGGLPHEIRHLVPIDLNEPYPLPDPSSENGQYPDLSPEPDGQASGSSQEPTPDGRPVGGPGTPGHAPLPAEKPPESLQQPMAHQERIPLARLVRVAPFSYIMLFFVDGATKGFDTAQAAIDWWDENNPQEPLEIHIQPN